MTCEFTLLVVAVLCCLPAISIAAATEIYEIPVMINDGGD